MEKEQKKQHPKEKKEEGKREERPRFPFGKYDMEDLYLECDPPKSLIDDLWTWQKDRSLFPQLLHELDSWTSKNAENKMLAKLARKAVQIVDQLLQKDVPDVVVEVFLKFMAKKKAEIQKDIDHLAADKLYRFIPPELTISYLGVFQIALTDKQKESLIRELIKNRKTCNQGLERLPQIFKDKNRYGKMLIDELTYEGKDDLAIKIMKKLKVNKDQYPEVQLKLIESAAIAMPKWVEHFSWAILEEVFEYYPSAIGLCMKNILSRKQADHQEQKGFASILKRIPQVKNRLPNWAKNQLKDLPNNLPNPLRMNRFQPSNPQLHLSLKQLGYSQESIIWVDKSNLEDCLKILSEQIAIGIDTQSRVARTSLDKASDVLATIQIATDSKVYIFDALALKRMKVPKGIMDKFFKNKKAVVVGHTLSADLNRDVTTLLGFDADIECQKIDICPIASALNPKQGRSLAAITKTMLGKELCKAYTLTNWQRRPLLRNQIHYAALDAVVVLKIWQKLKQRQQYGPVLEKLAKKDKNEPNPQKQKEREERLERYKSKEGKRVSRDRTKKVSQKKPKYAERSN